jgi:hypothetical protein
MAGQEEVMRLVAELQDKPQTRRDPAAVATNAVSAGAKSGARVWMKWF